MQLSTMKFTSTFALVACAVAAQASTVAQVLTDIGAINAGVTSLNNKVLAFPLTGGTLANALAIHNAAGALVSTINTATIDTTSITPLPLSLDDGTSIIDAVDALKPTILSALTGIVTVKPAFAALPVGGIPALVKSDLSNLSAATTAFEDALIASAPAEILSRANDIQSTINAAFATAISAYA
ncbi:hypothetical protein D9619_011329 [Psilocybe cf. subviscida]|uniref:Hydrophobic surface binding protein n=1 Tax=Psilocybe cf. subviscida TaxID=2480587 RepID=A0A8H5BIZ4_9AGAR|nr:hypothetical protein D9619_011329 [Psilocybe cf. subviscida]